MTQTEMERGGYYNAHSRPQGNAGDLGIPLLQRAVAEMPIGDGPIGIADFGVAQGRNSMAPMRAAITAIRARSASATVSVTHTDIPGNDFTSLFELLASDESYLRGNDNVFAYAGGRSFYERLFPPRSLTIGWNAIAVHWLSRVPCEIPDSIWTNFATGDVHGRFARQSAADWEAFLTAREIELVPGGQIVIVGSYTNDDGKVGAEGLMQVADEQLRAMVADGTLPATQFAAMAMPTYYRTNTEFEAPFHAANSAFTLLESTSTELPDAFWPAYQQTHDAGAFADAYTGFFRAFSEPCLFGSPTPIAEAFYRGLHDRIAVDPERVVSNWSLLLLRFQRK